MVIPIAWKYSMLAFLAVMGVLQFVAARNSLHQFLFFRNRVVSYAFSLVTVGFSFYYFFTWNSRFQTGVIEGAEQAGLFSLAALTALICSLVFSYTVRSTANKSRPVPEPKIKVIV